ncbi:hypothetical protein L195_g043974, partial [Trifolium pratense]
PSAQPRTTLFFYPFGFFSQRSFFGIRWFYVVLVRSFSASFGSGGSLTFIPTDPVCKLFGSTCVSTARLPSDDRLSYITINSPPPSLVGSRFARVVVGGGGSSFFGPFMPAVLCLRGLWYVNLSVLAVSSFAGFHARVSSFAVSYLN